MAIDFEEQLVVQNTQTVQYWRGDGNAWDVYLQQPAQFLLALLSARRACATGDESSYRRFTLTLADGTQKIFNSQNLLAAIVDRNNNQTTLAYDS